MRTFAAVALGVLSLVGFTDHAMATPVPVTLEGGVNNGFDTGTVATSILVAAGIFNPEQSTSDSHEILELAVGLNSFSAVLQLPNGTQLPPYRQVLLAPGVRYRLTAARVQPYFTLHAGWAPYLPTEVNGVTLASIFKSYAARVGFGLQVAVDPRFQLGLGGAVTSTAVIAGRELYTFSSYSGFLTLTAVLGKA